MINRPLILLACLVGFGCLVCATQTKQVWSNDLILEAVDQFTPEELKALDELLEFIVKADPQPGKLEPMMPRNNIIKGVLAYMDKRLAESGKPTLSDTTFYLDRAQGRQRFYDSYFKLVHPHVELVDELLGDLVRYYRHTRATPEHPLGDGGKAVNDWATVWSVATSILMNPVEQWAYDSLHFDNSLLGKGCRLIGNCLLGRQS